VEWYTTFAWNSKTNSVTRTNRENRKREYAGCTCRGNVNAKFFFPGKERAMKSHCRGNNLIIDVNIPCMPEVKATQIRKDDSLDKTEKSKCQCCSKGLTIKEILPLIKALLLGSDKKRGIPLPLI